VSPGSFRAPLQEKNTTFEGDWRIIPVGRPYTDGLNADKAGVKNFG
jgi:hypothetical protein